MREVSQFNIVLDIGKTNVKLYLLHDNNSVVRIFKTKQKIKFYKKKIKLLDAHQIIDWLLKIRLIAAAKG